MVKLDIIKQVTPIPFKCPICKVRDLDILLRGLYTCRPCLRREHLNIDDIDQSEVQSSNTSKVNDVNLIGKSLVLLKKRLQTRLVKCQNCKLYSCINLKSCKCVSGTRLTPLIHLSCFCKLKLPIDTFYQHLQTSRKCLISLQCRSFYPLVDEVHTKFCIDFSKSFFNLSVPNSQLSECITFIASQNMDFYFLLAGRGYKRRLNKYKNIQHLNICVIDFRHRHWLEYKSYCHNKLIVLYVH